MNDRDSEIIRGILIERGFVFTPNVEDADIILFNTCSVRAHAEERVYGKLGMLKVMKKERPEIIFGVLGCMAQNYKEEIFKKVPHVDLVCGTGNIYELPDLLEKLLNDRDKFVHRSFNIEILRCAQNDRRKCHSDPECNEGEESKYIAVNRTERPDGVKSDDYREGSIRTYVTIMEGCDNFCSYCIVPYVRGREKSRQPEDILREISDLAQRGFKEVTLLGQNVNSYGRGLDVDTDFVRLLEKVNDIDGIERIRFITNHPKDAGVELFRAMAELPKVCEHIHLPVQSGSDRILKAMNRGYSAGDYRRLIEELRKLVPGCSITTDIIVGFPGEEKGDFQETYRLMKDHGGFDSAFIFKYSPRRRSAAWHLEDDVPREVKEERNQILLELQEEITLEKNKNLIGKVAEVLVEEKGRRSGPVLQDAGKDGNSVWKGRTRTNKKVVFSNEDEDLQGSLVEVKIVDIKKETLLGTKNVV